MLQLISPCSSPVLMFRFDPTSYTVSESSGFVNITVVKQNSTSQTVNITLSTTDGTAAGEDT